MLPAPNRIRVPSRKRRVSRSPVSRIQLPFPSWTVFVPKTSLDSTRLRRAQSNSPFNRKSKACATPTRTPPVNEPLPTLRGTTLSSGCCGPLDRRGPSRVEGRKEFSRFFSTRTVVHPHGLCLIFMQFGNCLRTGHGCTNLGTSSRSCVSASSESTSMLLLTSGTEIR